MLHHNKNGDKAFTIVELLVIAPIVILTIGSFITAIIGMTGNVMSTRSSNVVAYNIQDALDRIKADVQVSGGFLANNSITLTTPQGIDDGTGVFYNAEASTGNKLILNAYATTSSPSSKNRDIIYLDSPNACNSAQVNLNPPVTINVIYFLKGNTLWRRVITDKSTDTKRCSKPWQQPSCTAGTGTNCTTKDMRLVDGISQFIIDYYSSTNPSITISDATDGTKDPLVRQSALEKTDSVKITISSSSSVAGRLINQSGTIRATRLNNNVKNLGGKTLIVPTAPYVSSGTMAIGETLKITSAFPDMPNVQWQEFNDNNGQWEDMQGQTSTTMTMTVTWDMHNKYYRAVFSNDDGYKINSMEIPVHINDNAWKNNFIDTANWSDFGAINGTWNTSGYRITSAGIVVLKGLIRRVGTNTAITTIGTLPDHYRPTGKILFPAATSGGAQVRITINSNGVVSVTGEVGDFLSLDGVSFSTNNGMDVSEIEEYQGGWSSFGNDYSGAQFEYDNEGRIHTQGLINVTPSTNCATDAFHIFFFTGTSLTMPIKPMYFAASSSNTTSSPFTLTQPGPYEIGFKGMATCGTWLSTNSLFRPFFSTADEANWKNITLPTADGSWATYAATGATPQYRKYNDGLVSLRGQVQGGTVSSGTLIGTLGTDSSFWPCKKAIRPTVSNGNYAAVSIDKDGKIATYASVENTWLSLDGISFYADNGNNGCGTTF